MKISATALERLRDWALHGRVVVFDTETTGTSCSDEICQLAAAEYIGGELTRTMNCYLSPTCEMHPGAEAVHHLSLDFLQEKGIEPEEAMTRFFDFLEDDVLLVAHNNRFDLRMLRNECAKFGVPYRMDGVSHCDTLALSRQLCPELPSHALGNLLAPLGVVGRNSHDALDDVYACAGVFFKLVELSRGL